jgi:hypothetical protein
LVGLAVLAGLVVQLLCLRRARLKRLYKTGRALWTLRADSLVD